MNRYIEASSFQYVDMVVGWFTVQFTVWSGRCGELVVHNGLLSISTNQFSFNDVKYSPDIMSSTLYRYFLFLVVCWVLTLLIYNIFYILIII